MYISSSQSAPNTTFNLEEVTTHTQPNKFTSSNDPSSQNSIKTAVLDSQEHSLAIGDITPYLNRSNSSRVYTSSHSNITASRSNVRLVDDESLGIALAYNTESDPDLLTIEAHDLQDRIIDHAYRRIQLFYFIAVAYYKENLSVSRDSTSYQHGMGSYYGMQAAHSSLLTSIKDNFLEELTKKIERFGVSNQVTAQLKALNISQKNLHQLTKLFPPGKKGHKKKLTNLQNYLPKEVNTTSLIGKDCYFYQALNSTVVLPKSVNMLDMVIEKHMRTRGIELINEVSQGLISPYEASHTLVQEIQDVLDTSYKQTNQKIHLLDQLYSAEQQLLQISQSIRTMDCQDETESLKALETFLVAARKNKSLRKDIQSLKDSISIEYHLNKRQKKMLNCVASVQPYLNPDFKSKKTTQHQYFVNNPSVVKQLLQEIKKDITSNKWYPYPMGWIRTELTGSLTAISLQKSSTSLPDQKLLSGVYENGVLRSMNKKELEEQKLEIIKRVPTIIYQDLDFPFENLVR